MNLETKQRLEHLHLICFVWAGLVWCGIQSLLSQVWILLPPHIRSPLIDWLIHQMDFALMELGRTGEFDGAQAASRSATTFPVISIALLETADRTREELSSGRLPCDSQRHEAHEDSLWMPAATQNHRRRVCNSGTRYQKGQAVEVYSAAGCFMYLKLQVVAGTFHRSRVKILSW